MSNLTVVIISTYTTLTVCDYQYLAYQIRKKEKADGSRKAYRYYTDNSNVAKVSKKSVITAKAKGRCLVYVLTNNGVYRKIKVTVK